VGDDIVAGRRRIEQLEAELRGMRERWAINLMRIANRPHKPSYVAQHLRDVTEGPRLGHSE
jgi:hypothetical protein